MPDKKISIRDIAEKSGVSVATVSRVINQNGRYSAETEARVRQIMEEYNYVPNLLARGLRQQQVPEIGIIVPDITNEFFGRLVVQIESELFEHGYTLTICNTNEDRMIERRYLEMIRLKTAVLLATALRIGAWIGGADDRDADLLYDFGINLGLAFQLKDDLLDVYGDERTFGKRIGGDISCNKKTYLLIHARQLARGDDAAELARWLATDVPSREKIEAVTALYDRLGVRRICEDKMEQYYKQAVASLDNVSVSADKKQELRKLADKLMLRNE